MERKLDEAKNFIGINMMIHAIGCICNIYKLITDTYTAARLNTSARPSEIVLSVGLVPYASLAPVVTLTCFIKFVVLVEWYW